MMKVFLLLLQCGFAILLEFQKPVAKTVWHERCTKHSYVLNDCNWCRCDSNHQYVCKARVCSEINMFGHFNDAIKSINVGMEGHGAWRTTGSACEPKVRYMRGSLVCVCDENGNWPNPICRDVFRVLYSIETTSLVPGQKCSPTKLYLVGCNVCVCLSSAHLDPEFCTKRKCAENDPVLHDKEQTAHEDQYIQDLYFECSPDVRYKYGCHTCICLRNNRLICKNCTDDKSDIEDVKNYCQNKEIGDVFNKGCNLCVCDENQSIYCTVKRCRKSSEKFLVLNVHNFPDSSMNIFEEPSVELLVLRNEHNFPDSSMNIVEEPFEEQNCIPGTQYKKNCNICYCFESDKGVKLFRCTMKQCFSKSRNILDVIKSDCVQGTVYEIDCLICQCEVTDNTKWQTCRLLNKCDNRMRSQESNSQDLTSLRGNCEALNVYKDDCNSCRCLSDGQIVACTAKVCKETTLEPITFDLIPITNENGGRCPNGRSYKIDCNYCFCLSNGNILCTTVKCKSLH